MSSIQRFYTKTFEVSRLAYVLNKSTYSVNGTFLGHIQQSQGELQEQIVDFYARLYLIWCPIGTDVQESDRIKEDGVEYKVKAIRVNGVGNNQHLEIIVHKNK